MRKSPCKLCEKRYLGCHSECDEYKEFKQEIEDSKEMIAKRKAEMTLIDDYKVESTYKSLKRNHYKKEK